MNAVRRYLVRIHLALAGSRGERGDVPGWVMIAVMTAGLCTALYAIAKGELSDLLGTALRDVTAGQ